MRPRPLPFEPGFEFNPLSPEYDRDPYPVLALLRDHAPVFPVPGVDALFLSRHEDVLSVLADEERFSADRSRWEHWTPPPPEHANHPIVRIQRANLLSYDGAEHTRLRKLASAALTRRAVRHLDALMHALADELIDAFIARGRAEFAALFPVAIISRLMGITPSSDREREFKSLADSVVVAFNPLCSEADKLRSIQSMTIHMENVRLLMEEKRANPGNDLLTDMVQAEDEGTRFSSDEILGTVLSLLVAGSETTANSLSFGLIELLRHPDQLARLELEIALGHVVERLAGLEIEGGFDAIPYRSNPAVRGPAALPVRFRTGKPLAGERATD